MPGKRNTDPNSALHKDPEGSRPQLRQTDIPRLTIEQALRPARALADQYAGQPVSPLNLAAALEMSPTSSNFPTLCSASSAYGLTDGTAKARRISLTALGRRIVRPTEEGDDRAAIVESVLMPAVERRFLEHYNGSPLPDSRIAQNVLATWGVPQKAAARSYATIRENAQFAGLITVIKGRECVDLSAVRPPESEVDDARAAVSPPAAEFAGEDAERFEEDVESGTATADPIQSSNRRVFIAHGRDLTVAGQIKELLEVVGMDPVIAIEEEATSKPLSEKVLEDLLSCSAGIIHVRAEKRLPDANGGEHVFLNQNVLIEIGAALAHFRRRLILLVEEGTELPSNVAGLYQVRYAGDELGSDAIMKVLRALQQFGERE